MAHKKAEKNVEKDTIRIGAEVDHATNDAIEKWAIAEGRSKREHVVILLRKLAVLWNEKPDDLVRVGLMDRLLGGSKSKS